MADRDPDLVFYFPLVTITRPVILSENGGWQNRVDIRVLTTDPQLQNIIGKYQIIDYINQDAALRKTFVTYILEFGTISNEYQFKEQPLYVTPKSSEFRRITDGTGEFAFSNGYIYLSIAVENKDAVRALVYLTRPNVLDNI